MALAMGVDWSRGRAGRVSHCIQSHHKTEKACMGLGFEKAIELVKIENGGSSLTFSLCRILRTLLKNITIMNAILMESHRLNSVNSFYSNIQCIQLD